MLVVVVVALAVSLPARAQQVDEGTRAAARDLGYAGVEAFEAGNFAVASGKLEKAFRVLKVPSLGLWSARALLKLGRLLEASERYREVGRLEVRGGDGEVQRQAQADAARELELLVSRIPGVTLQIEGGGLPDDQVTLDGTPLALELIGENRPVNPGRHRLEARRGDALAEAEVSVAEGEKKTVVLRFEGAAAIPPSSSRATAAPATRAAPKPGSTRRTLGFVALAAGGVGLGVGAVTGFLAMGKHGEIEDNPRCVSDRCATSEQGLVDSYSSLRSFSTVGFVAGGVLAATGVVLILTSKSSSRPQTGLRLHPRSVALFGSF
jgi:hypothetical protein